MKMGARVLVAIVLCALSAAASAYYAFVYLSRWEWHRAIVALGVLIASEIPLATFVVLARLRSIEAKVDAVTARIAIRRCRSSAGMVVDAVPRRGHRACPGLAMS